MNTDSKCPAPAMAATSTAALQKLERKLAYSAARSDIEVYGEPRSLGELLGEGEPASVWSDLRLVPDELRGPAVEYLDLRGLLVRADDNPNMVRVLDDPTEEV